jgi:hypothetical protein
MSTPGVAELDGASNVGVQVGEELPPPRHVVRRTTIQEPAVNLVVARAVVKKDARARLVEVE